MKGTNPRQMPSGSWRSRLVLADGREVTKSFARKVDAVRWLDEMRGKRAGGGHINPAGERTKFRVVAEEWFCGKEASTRGNTRDRYRHALDSFVLPEFGDRAIGKIRRADIQRWVTGLSRPVDEGGSGLAATTTEVVYRVCAAVLRHAVDERLIPSSEARRIGLPSKSDEAHTLVPIALAQVHELAEAAGDWGDMVLFAASTGLRGGEVLGLTADRVDLERRTVRVDRQLVLRAGHEPTFGPCKTKASNRTVPIGDWTCRLIAPRVAAAAPRGLLWTESGDPIRRNRHGERIKKISAEAGLTVTFHDLRHFYASTLLAAGESVKVVQARLGHASAMETLNTYGHLMPDSEEGTRRAMDTVFGGH